MKGGEFSEVENHHTRHVWTCRTTPRPLLLSSHPLPSLRQRVEKDVHRHSPRRGPPDVTHDPSPTCEPLWNVGTPSPSRGVVPVPRGTYKIPTPPNSVRTQVRGLSVSFISTPVVVSYHRFYFSSESKLIIKTLVFQIFLSWN